MGQEIQAAIARDEPVSYRIQVQGHLSQTWAGYLGGMELSIEDRGTGAVTTLSGQVMDQAALMGILNGLYDLGLPLLSVEHQSIPGKQVAKN